MIVVCWIMICYVIVSSWCMWMGLNVRAWLAGLSGLWIGMLGVWVAREFVRRVGWWSVSYVHAVKFDSNVWDGELCCGACACEKPGSIGGLPTWGVFTRVWQNGMTGLRRSYAGHWNGNSVLRRGYAGPSPAWFAGWAWGAVARAVRLGLRRSGAGSVKGPGRSWKVFGHACELSVIGLIELTVWICDENGWLPECGCDWYSYGWDAVLRCYYYFIMVELICRVNMWLMVR